MKEFLRGILAVASFVGVGVGLALMIIGFVGDGHTHRSLWLAGLGCVIAVASAISTFTVSRPFYRTRACQWITLSYSVFMAAVFVIGLVLSLIDRDWKQALLFVAVLAMVCANNLRLTIRKLKEPRP